MKTSMQYYEEAKKKLEITSDYSMAQWLGVTKQTVSGYKNGSRIIDDYTAARIAEALEIDAMEVIAVANAEREKSEERKNYWRKVAERCVAAIFMAVFIGGSMHYTLSDRKSFKINSVYYVKYCAEGHTDHPCRRDYRFLTSIAVGTDFKPVLNPFDAVRKPVDLPMNQCHARMDTRNLMF